MEMKPQTEQSSLRTALRGFHTKAPMFPILEALCVENHLPLIPFFLPSPYSGE